MSKLPFSKFSELLFWFPMSFVVREGNPPPWLPMDGATLRRAAASRANWEMIVLASKKDLAKSSLTWIPRPVILLMAEILHQLRLVVYPIIYRVSYIPGEARFQPSTVPPMVWCFRYVFGVQIPSQEVFGCLLDVFSPDHGCLDDFCWKKLLVGI